MKKRKRRGCGGSRPPAPPIMHLAVFLGMFFLFGCKGEKNPAVGTEARLYWGTEKRDNAVYLVDREDNAIEIKVYQRIVVLSPGAVETLYLIGGEAGIAGIAGSREGIFPEEKTGLLPNVGNAAHPNLEAIIALEPDLVIGNAMNSAFMADLHLRGYRGILHSAESMADIFNSTLLLGRLTGAEDAARQLVAEKTAVLETLKEGLRREPLNLKGGFLYGVNPIMGFTSDSLAGEILDLLGVVNIAAGLEAAQPILSPEYILAQDPDFLFGAMSIAKPEDILGADSVISQTKAGRAGNISIVPSSLFLRPSPRLVDTLLTLYAELEGYRNKTGTGA